MSTVSFLLKKPAKTTGLSLIYLQFKYKGNRLLASTGHSIEPKLWSKERQRVKNNQTTSLDGQHYLNNLLTNMSDVVMQAYRQESVNGIPTTKQIKKHLNDFFSKNLEAEKKENDKESLYDLIGRFKKNEILHKGRQKSVSTINSYITTYKHLKAFEKLEAYPIEFETITVSFFYKWMAYLFKAGIQTNTQNKYVGCLKAFMSEGLELGLHNNMDFKKKRFSVGEVLTDTIYLKEEELIKIFNVDLSQDLKLQHVQHAFLISSYTGVRFGDIKTLKIEHFQEIDGETFIRKTTLKTGEEIIIPVHKNIIAILKAYQQTKSKLPIVPCNQVYNRLIKNICQLAGLREKGRLINQPEKMLFELVCSHTARRTFATLAYLAGIPPLDIMRLTSHKSEKNLMRYIRLSKLHAAQRYSQIRFSNASKPNLKVAI